MLVVRVNCETKHRTQFATSVDLNHCKASAWRRQSWVHNTMSSISPHRSHLSIQNVIMAQSKHKILIHHSFSWLMVTTTKGKSISERPSHLTLSGINERRKIQKMPYYQCVAQWATEERGHFYIGVILGPLEGTYHMSLEVFWNPWDRPRYDLEVQASENWAECRWAGQGWSSPSVRSEIN